MAHKRIGHYTDIQAHAPASISAADQLIIEIGTYQVVIMVKSQLPKQIENFEVFMVDAGNNGWTATFESIKKTSTLLDRHYNNVWITYNQPEALAIPSAQFTTEAGKDFLDQIYGDAQMQTATHETVFAAQIEIAYRVKRELLVWVEKEWPRHKSTHIYADLLNNLFTRSLPAGSFISIRFFGKHLVLALMKDKQLQLIQSFSYNGEADILYYIMSVCQQFEVDPQQAQTEISGELDKQSAIAKQLPSLLGNITWEAAGNTGIFSKVTAQYPAHYFTHYYKLGA